MVQLRKVPIDYLEEVILEEELVTNAADCHKIALSAFRKLVKEQNAKPQTSKLVCFGGKYSSTKVTVVYDLNNDLIYCIGGDFQNRLISSGTDGVCR